MTSTAAVRRKAAAAAAVVGFQAVVVQVISFVGGIVLARLLQPRDFGILAFGMALSGSLAFIADAGLGASLIRRHEEPERADVEAIFGTQLLTTTALTAVIVLSTVWFGIVGQITALMALTIPLNALRTPGTITLERKLDYRPLTMSAILSSVAYLVWTIPLVVAGAGVWALATGAIVRSVVSAGIVVFATRHAHYRPRFDWGRTKPYVAFGSRFLAIDFVNLVRDQGFNFGIAAVGGVTALGLWNLAYRILQIPYLLFVPLWRVSFPAMSRLAAAGDDLRPTVERLTGLVAVPTGLILVPLVAASPLTVPALLGTQWNGIQKIFPGVCLGLMFGGPISVAVAGFLYGVGDAKTPLRATIVHTVVWLGISLPLLDTLGPWAIGIGACLSSVADSWLLARGARRHERLDLIRPLLVPTTAAVLVGGGGWLLCTTISVSVVAALSAAALSELIYAVLLVAFSKRLVFDCIRVARTSVRTAVAG